MMEGIYHDPSSSSQAAKTLMNLEDPPTAIMFPDDYSYLGGMARLEKNGYIDTLMKSALPAMTVSR